MAHASVLVRSSDTSIGLQLVHALCRLGLHAELATDGRSLPSEPWHVTVLVRVSADHTTLEHAIDELRDPAPIIVIGGSRHEAVSALEAGAADFLPRPVRLRELHSRIRALHRRTSRVRPRTTAASDEVLALLATATASGLPLPSTFPSAADAAVLGALLSRAGQFVHRDTLFDVMGRAVDGRAPRVLNDCIRRLRVALTATTEPSYAIDTIRGAGYRLRIAAAGPAAAGSEVRENVIDLRVEGYVSTEPRPMTTEALGERSATASA